METVYIIVFAMLATAAVSLQLSKVAGDAAISDTAFKWFRFNYLVVYSLMMAGDWLQGPYIYALYQHYEFSRGQIAVLFAAGYLSSMLLGTIAGAMADRSGRKKAVLAYAVLYATACLAKHSGSFGALLVGRVLCGVATSLLVSALEAWLVAEHTKRGFDTSWLGGVFATAVFCGNGLVAILAGLLAHYLVEAEEMSPTAPFDVAILALAAGAGLVAYTWTENSGINGELVSLREQFSKARRVILTDQRIMLIGAVQAMFEGAMYTFIFLWTPALSAKGEALPHGMIFACFMAAVMLGAAIAGRILQGRMRAELALMPVLAIAAMAVFVPVFFHVQLADAVESSDDAPGISAGGVFQLLMFCVFETMVGMYWPLMMKLRADYLPEELRATIISLFRLPLNAFVVFMLFNVNNFALGGMFGLCTLLLFAASICQGRLAAVVMAQLAFQALEKGDVEEAQAMLPNDDLRGASEKLVGREQSAKEAAAAKRKSDLITLRE